MSNTIILVAEWQKGTTPDSADVYKFDSLPELVKYRKRWMKCQLMAISRQSPLQSTSNSLSGSQLKYKKDSQVESSLSSPKNGVLKMQKAALLFLDRPEHPGIDKLFPDLF